jgi:hypothetical protein
MSDFAGSLGARGSGRRPGRGPVAPVAQLWHNLSDAVGRTMACQARCLRAAASVWPTAGLPRAAEHVRDVEPPGAAPSSGSGKTTRREWRATSGDQAPWRSHPSDSDWSPAVRPSFYEIRVAGVLPPEALLDFERLTASVQPVETVLQVPLLDQAALHGLLARLEALGVQVLEIRRLRRVDPPAGQQGPAGR